MDRDKSRDEEGSAEGEDKDVRVHHYPLVQRCTCMKLSVFLTLDESYRSNGEMLMKGQLGEE